jgi:hypothetical protein
MSDIQPPITRIDGGPQQFNTEAYHYDGGQPLTKTALTGSAGDQDSGKTVDQTKLRQADPTTARTDDPGTVRTGTQGQDVTNNVRRRRIERGTSTGNCSTANYGDSGSGLHDHDSWRPGADRSHAKQGSLAEKWWQAQASLPADIKTDNGLYAVQFGDCLETIAKRQLVTEGQSVTRKSLKREMDLIVRLNDCHYQSLDNNRDYLMTGWKLILHDDSTQNGQPSPPSAQIKESTNNRNRTAPPNFSTSDNYYTAPPLLEPQARTREYSLARIGDAHRPQYTAISMPNPQSHIQFTPAVGPHAHQKIDIRASLRPDDVVLYHERGSLPRVIYLGPNDHRPPTKQIYEDGTVGPVTDPEFVAWINDCKQQPNGYVAPARTRQRTYSGNGLREGQQNYPPDGLLPGRQSQNYSQQPDYMPAPAPAPAPAIERHTYNGPIPHYTAVAWNPQRPIQFFSPPTGHVDKTGAYVVDKPGQHIDLVQADNLQSTDAVLVHEGSLAKIYYLGGHVENRPPNKEIYADGTAGDVRDQNFVDWSNSFYGTAAKAVVRINPAPTAVKIASQETAQIVTRPPNPVAAPSSVKQEVPSPGAAPKQTNEIYVADNGLDAP